MSSADWKQRRNRKMREEGTGKEGQEKDCVKYKDEVGGRRGKTKQYGGEQKKSLERI